MPAVPRNTTVLVSATAVPAPPPIVAPVVTAALVLAPQIPNISIPPPIQPPNNVF